MKKTFNRKQADELENKLASLDKLKSKKLKRAEKELFDTVYNWGLWRIKVDRKCNTFQILLERYVKALQEEAKK